MRWRRRGLGSGKHSWVKREMGGSSFKQNKQQGHSLALMMRGCGGAPTKVGQQSWRTKEAGQRDGHPRGRWTGPTRKDWVGHAKDGGLEAISAETFSLEVTQLENLEKVGPHNCGSLRLGAKIFTRQQFLFLPGSRDHIGSILRRRRCDKDRQAEPRVAALRWERLHVPSVLQNLPLAICYQTKNRVCKVLGLSGPGRRIQTHFQTSSGQQNLKSSFSRVLSYTPPPPPPPTTTA